LLAFLPLTFEALLGPVLGGFLFTLEEAIYRYEQDRCQQQEENCGKYDYR
jgi:hypothetical protein